jgi:(p)ppGpp synthase/HD superfamily hydrolase
MTDKIRKAIRFASKTHDFYQKQKRKIRNTSYITHPLMLGILLAKVGADDDIVSAGILHDTIEDSLPEKKVSREMLSERFGEKVADIVSDLSEDQNLSSWQEKKRRL